MDEFHYQNGALHAEGLPVEQIAEQFGTPTYVYSAATLMGHWRRLAEAFAPADPVICYSVKSCQNLNILRLFAAAGSGFDIVSGGELYRALRAGGNASRMVYAGVGKTDPEIHQAIDAGIALFNIESEAELANLCALAGGRKQRVDAALRVNPDVEREGHAYTTTGKKGTKFGVDIDRAAEVFERFGRDEHVRLRGVHLHIGSPVNSTEPYVEAITKALALIETLRRRGLTIDVLNIGGGFGADYTGGEAPMARDYAAAILPLLEGQGLRLFLEPGRSIAANGAILLTRVLFIKESGPKRFVIVDAAMNDLIRPALYGAYHFIWPVKPGEGMVPRGRAAAQPLEGLHSADVVGPICESGDFFAKDRPLPPVKRGDLVAVFTVGAYCFVMSNNFNSRPRAAEVLVEGEAPRLIRRRETYEDLVAAEDL